MLNKRILFILFLIIGLLLSLYNDRRLLFENNKPDLDAIFLEINNDTTVAQLHEIAKKHNGYLERVFSYSQIYRIYDNNNFGPDGIFVDHASSGSWIECDFKYMSDMIDTVSYYIEDKNIVAKWTNNDRLNIPLGYSVYNLNDQSKNYQLPQDNNVFTPFIPVASANDVINYIPSHSSNNLLDFFISLSNITDYDELLESTKQNNLFLNRLNMISYHNASFYNNYDYLKDYIRITVQGMSKKQLTGISYYELGSAKEPMQIRFDTYHNEKNYYWNGKHYKTIEEMVEDYNGTIQ